MSRPPPPYRKGDSMGTSDIELEKIHAEIVKLMAETNKINSENKYYPVVITATATLALVAIVKLFL